jgi:glycosyltransferase involved in cell wall biosynthesis
MSRDMPEWEYEHIVCDNASTDQTVFMLEQLAKEDPNLKVIVNNRNVGPFRNMANGLKYATGDMIVPMLPADLQDPPEALPKMIDLMKNQVDVVFGIRQNRKENFVLGTARNFYYWLSRITSNGMAPPKNAGEFLVARKRVVDEVIPILGEYPYIRALISQAASAVETFGYDWERRNHGKSRNSISDLLDQGLNGLITTARTPIRWALLFGIVVSFLGVILGLLSLMSFIFGGTQTVQGIPTLIVGMFLFGGIQLFFLGLVGEYVLHIHSEIRRSPGVIVTRKINFNR